MKYTNRHDIKIENPIDLIKALCCCLILSPFKILTELSKRILYLPKPIVCKILNNAIYVCIVLGVVQTGISIFRGRVYWFYSNYPISVYIATLLVLLSLDYYYSDVASLKLPRLKKKPKNNKLVSTIAESCDAEEDDKVKTPSMINICGDDIDKEVGLSNTDKEEQTPTAFVPEVDSDEIELNERVKQQVSTDMKDRIFGNTEEVCMEDLDDLMNSLPDNADIQLRDKQFSTQLREDEIVEEIKEIESSVEEDSYGVGVGHVGIFSDTPENEIPHGQSVETLFQNETYI